MSKKKNKTGVSDDLKSGIEALSSISPEDVKVHYSSSKPAQLNADGMMKSDAAWHVVQPQKGRVKIAKSTESKTKINDAIDLEKEADRLGSDSIKK
nr:hypothetical protein [uncultured Flavobacterium sp.]